MQTHDEQLEAHLGNVMETFKRDMRDAVDTAMSDVHCNLLPHVLSDAETNLSFLVTEVLEKVLAGQFRTESNADGSTFVLVVQDYKGWYHYIRDLGSNTWPSLIQKIYDTATKEVENTRIQQLEAKVESLQQSLSEAWRR